jgi:hypothetical protein
MKLAAWVYTLVNVHGPKFDRIRTKVEDALSIETGSVTYQGLANFSSPVLIFSHDVKLARMPTYDQQSSVSLHQERVDLVNKRWFSASFLVVMIPR